MGIVYKVEDIASGILEFKFYYDDSENTIDDNFIITSTSPLSEGYDNEDNREVSIYPSNFEITIDDFSGDNYTIFKALLEKYETDFPFNFSDIFILELLLNGETIFTGFLETVNGDANVIEMNLKFIDGINKLKEINIGNPAVLHKLHLTGIIKESTVVKDGNIIAYGYGLKVAIANPPPYINEYLVVTDIENQDKDTNIISILQRLFKMVLPEAVLELENEYLFGDLNSDPSNMVTIDQVDVRRVCSTLLGRYVVVKKDHLYMFTAFLVGEYSKLQYFENVYEDDDWITYYHNWSGNFPENINIKKWERGLSDVTANEIIKKIARNLFSYFGFKKNGVVFFRHRRFLENPVELNEDNIESMNKVLTIDKVQAVKIADYYNSSKSSQQGHIYKGEEERIVTYAIPLNAFRTDNGYEYRMVYHASGVEKQVIYFYDKQSQVFNFPSDVIAQAEFGAFQKYRDKYEINLIGVNYKFDSTYRIIYQNYNATVRPVTMEKDFLNDSTKLIALELND